MANAINSSFVKITVFGRLSVPIPYFQVSLTWYFLVPLDCLKIQDKNNNNGALDDLTFIHISIENNTMDDLYTILMLQLR